MIKVQNISSNINLAIDITLLIDMHTKNIVLYAEVELKHHQEFKLQLEVLNIIMRKLSIPSSIRL